MGCGFVPSASVLCEIMTPDPCRSKAINMSRCLRANRYQEGVCFDSMSVMEKCCTRWKDRSQCCLIYERLRHQHEISCAQNEKFVKDSHFTLGETYLCH